MTLPCTPGPWRVIFADPYLINADTLIVGPDFPGNGIIARVNRAKTSRDGEHYVEEADGNAQLLAAAQEMAVMIRELRNLLNEAIDVHIYGDDDKPEPECGYIAAVRDADALLARITEGADPFSARPQNGPATPTKEQADAPAV